MTARNTNHPKKGSTTKVEPIRTPKSIRAIKNNLKEHPRDLCLFTFGINTAYRAGEILSLTVGQVQHLKAGDRLEIKQPKSKKYRAITINKTVESALQNWLAQHPKQNDLKAPLFISQRTGGTLTVSTVNNLVKKWCRDIKLAGNYGSHSMRKTWGYHQRVYNSQPIPLLMVAFGHTSQAQTLDYLCVQDDEVRNLYDLKL